ncbi:hypothetical protein [Chondromyces apiculatus]|uniref:Uncharacterized protein n=1 Tax=Chondromyces apiculatus DSM 436 TaxID=1192034 RepID=A0A017T0V5_9BACT|nr:hypothetical protein [Chondromyces apiculatus]EYF02602.1 Hypothetical protein CAP_6713 [Chondromyces apiculatus DSM 436]
MALRTSSRSLQKHLRPRWCLLALGLLAPGIVACGTVEVTPSPPPATSPPPGIDAPVWGPAVGNQSRPMAAWNGTTDFAVWNDSRPVQTYGARLAPDGAVLDGSSGCSPYGDDGFGINVVTPSGVSLPQRDDFYLDHGSQPFVVGDGQRALLLWSQHHDTDGWQRRVPRRLARRLA